MPSIGDPPERPRAMTDRRLLRRYLALVRHVDELLEETGREELMPAPAEAVAMLDDLTYVLAPIVEKLPRTTVSPEELRCQLAGWVH